MADALDQASAEPPQEAIGKTEVGEAEPTGRVGVKIKAAIFFDGTGNNENNIKKRIKDPAYMAVLWDPLGARESYKAAYSNVALLHFMHQKKLGDEKIVSVYVEGIGTTNDGDDDLDGGAFGSGPTGIPTRVTQGINRLAAGVKVILGTQRDSYLEELTIYTFGFSRGAAAARHFCARRANSQGRGNNLCDVLGAKPAVVKLKFLGLFETVSSFDQNANKDGEFWSRVKKAASHYLTDYSFRNDVPELHLNLDDPTLEKVVQLRAADEYRINFSVTTIESATSQHKGLELLLPGAHSDLGGGYQPGAIEKVDYKTPAQYRLAAYFKNQGWYLPTQLVTTFQDQGQGVPKLRVITGTRTPGNSFQHVSLAVMLKLIVAAGCEVTFDTPTEPGERRVKYTVPPGRLATIRDQLVSYAEAQFAARPAAAVTAPVAEADYHWLRQHYLHLSWKNSLGMEMRVNDDAYRDQQQQDEYDQVSAEAQKQWWAAKATEPADSTAAPITALPESPPPPPPLTPHPDDNYRPVRWVIHG